MKRNQAQKFIVLFLLFLFAYSWRVEAQTGKEKQITMEFKNEGLPSIFKRFEKVSGYKVLFIYDEISSYTSTGKVEKATVDEALKVIIGKNPLKYHIDGQFINITQKDSKKFFSQVKGKVLSEEDGLPVVGATIIVEDPSNIRTITDNNGNFQLSDVPKDSRVRISYVGLETQFLHPSSYMSVVMKSDTRALDEVVVTGMFNRKKEGFTGSAVTIKGEDLKKYSTNNVAKAIAAVAPGLRIVDNINMGSNPNGLPDMRMRGSANMDMGTQSVDFNSTSNDVLAVQGEYETYANQPLLIMDGFEISIQTLADMDPDRVASIVLLKDAAATAIYGSRAANGVIVIESKTPKPGRIWVFTKFAKGYREFELNKALALPTGYSLRFYMLMSGQVYPLDISLENLKDRLGIPADKYKDKNGKDRIDHFEERVLKPAKAALDESCPYTFNYVKVRENPNNKRSKVTGFRFYPVYQPQFRDEELEGKELQAKVTARYQIDSHVYEYLRYSCGFTSEEINRNKETFITAQEKITDLIGELALLNGKSREKNNPKGWIINALKGKIKDK